MDNNLHKEINIYDDYSDDYSDNETTKYNDNLRVIITPIFPQRKKKLIKGDYVNIDKFKDKLTIPLHSYIFPKIFMRKELSEKNIKYFNKLQFPINITEKLSDNVFIDKTTHNIIIIGLSVEDIYRYLYLDNILYLLNLNHHNGYCLSSPHNNFLLFDDDILEDDVPIEKDKLKIIDNLLVNNQKDKIPFRKYNLDINIYDKKTLLNEIEIEFIKNKLR